MIYKLQRLYAEKDKPQGNNNKPQGNKSQGKQYPEYVAPKITTVDKWDIYETPEQARKAVEKEYLEESKKMMGNTHTRDLKTGERKTSESLRKTYEAKMDSINKYEEQLKKVKKLEKQEARKEKFNKAKDKVVNWAKKNKKGLIIGGSVLAAGTGATIVGSKIHKKNKQNKIKEDVRGYSDVED